MAADKDLEAIIENKFLQVRQAGLAAGTKAVAGVVYDMATNEGKTIEERLKDITEFCIKGLKVNIEEKAV